MFLPASDRRPALPADTPADVVISGALGIGEHVIWTGRPPCGLDFRERDWGEVVQALAVHAVEVAVMGNFVGPLVILINGMTSGWYATRVLDRIVYQPRRRRRTWYGLTAERVVVAELVRGEIEVRSTRLTGVGIARLTERADGSGEIDLYLPARSWFARRMRRAGSPVGCLTRLELAADARRVYNLIRDARRAIPGAETAPDPHAERSAVLVESE